ncbi:putative PLP-dependent transferase [Mycobacteroides abscessus subsp. abscessus]|uniref:3'-phosphate/5'-hydroxy nucleic acid ligase n=1 Tax=Mycobacteroides abscessus subsp. abscessus TaxID=1185650 RepID=A0AB38D1C8_9MYCO|nr:putative PLP-dependent transferase [Mycobacteroides abscessus subsp. abscessus]SKU87210.1 RNA-splicing ligase RtcB [Mycobacteroides abscessus subsp. bolletii]SIA13360.1 RNA-splicing ligase RtcB [Mycobacteroides abscessus subsp. abscessus]SIB13374.1 RNA-splicing ligase RtcB [Mycobacteroides abscessus subsp. abscessus]SIB15521.1 RNA-splicing ligase RtcB [Mycobacteroides abscessus subsp. abscessus]
MKELSQRIGDNIISFASEIDYTTIEQAKETATLPFIYPHMALMPDAHSGKGSAVGTVIPTVGAVIPAAVGVDIGCGMIAVKTRFTECNLLERFDGAYKSHLSRLRVAIEEAIPLSPGNYNADTKRFPFTRKRIEGLIQLQNELNVDLSHSPKWMEQLGSLGGGNHFIELCLDSDDTVWLFLHSGSRGVGNKIAQKHIKAAQNQLVKHQRYGIAEPVANKDLAYLSEGTCEFDRYIKDLRWAQQFAYDNRAEMMDRYVRVFADWLGVQSQRVELDRVNCHHNYTVATEIDGRKVWLTRKGAIDASEGKLGLIPGSMGTRSYVVRGRGNKDGLFSAPHGAGRRFSRTKAKELFTLEDLAEQMQGIEYRHGEQWIDEIPSCYKPIDQVMKDAEPLVEVVTELRQILNVKGT